MLEVWSQALLAHDCSLPCRHELYPEFKKEHWLCVWRLIDRAAPWHGKALGSIPSASRTKPELRIKTLHRQLDCCC